MRRKKRSCSAQAVAGVRWWESPSPPDSHGEFGLVNEWLNIDQRREDVRNWLATASEIADIAQALTHGPNEGIEPDELVSFARDRLFERIGEAIANREITGDGMAERLAEAAILPMYGMPSRVRLLYHQLRRGISRVIDRD